jgi:hypothetical protein
MFATMKKLLIILAALVFLGSCITIMVWKNWTGT